MAAPGHGAPYPVADAPVVSSFSYAYVKRGFDFVLASAGLLVLAPLFVLLALLVIATSPGPALYRWDVVGRGGRYFRGYKFRTMVRDADERKAELLSRNEMTGPVFKVRDDPRITSVGRVLRRYSLDELPQLWSVVAGDMSLVGPRPAGQLEWEHYEPWQRQRLGVTPGVTGAWQVSGRHRVSEFSDWVRMDLVYIREWSLTKDFTILAKTIAEIARGSGV